MTKIAIIGGGAAGFFAAITCAEEHPHAQVVVFERGKSVLEKVRISGGGRCNVTHACFEARELVRFYPRGQRELLGPFLQFGPNDTVAWFESRGVRLKTEADGRMFPTTDDSATIADCLIRSAQAAGVTVRTGARVEHFAPQPDGRWELRLAGQETPLVFDRLMVAAGSSTAVWAQLEALGHQIVPPVPSLFTFNTKDTRLRDLSGLSVPMAALRVPGTALVAEGPLLVTHWGLSGPAILRLSAWGARELRALDYRFPLDVSWIGPISPAVAKEQLLGWKNEQARKLAVSAPPFGLPLRLWQHLAEAAALPAAWRWGDVGKTALDAVLHQLTAGRFAIAGKSTFKEEFVTAGGVSLKEIDFKRFASKRLPNLYLAGETLDIDAITGGFNFQAAWTGGWLAGKAMGEL